MFNTTKCACIIIVCRCHTNNICVMYYFQQIIYVTILTKGIKLALDKFYPTALTIWLRCVVNNTVNTYYEQCTSCIVYNSCVVTPHAQHTSLTNLDNGTSVFEEKNPIKI